MPPNRRDEPVVLSRIYTKTGDDGSTALADGSRAPKTDLRLAAYADVEEANCAIGVAVALGQPGPELVTLLTRIQKDTEPVAKIEQYPKIEGRQMMMVLAPR